ncbi:MAG: hypothetical protein AAGI38_14025 [Bacteroidota bacterium]
MSEFDVHTIRDPEFRQQIEQKIAEVAAVQKRNKFLTYTENEPLLDELEALIKANSEAYQEAYLQPKKDLEAVQAELERRKSAIHPLDFQSLNDFIAQIKHLLDQPEYATNRKAIPSLTSLKEQLEKATVRYSHARQQLAERKDRLKAVQGLIWGEQFDRWEQGLEEFQAAVNGASQLPSKLPLEEKELMAAQEERSLEVNTFKQTLPPTSPYIQQVEATTGTYLKKETFLQLKQNIEADLAKAKRKRMQIRVLALVLVFVCATAAPFAWQYFQEANRWETASSTGTYEAYEAYVDAYPAGKYTAQAREAMLALPAGRLKEVMLADGSTYVYEGELLAGIPHGQGMADFEDGRTFQGNWEQGQFAGQGRLTVPEQYEDQGNFSQNLPEGNGLMKWNDGRSYSGDWKKGLPDGQGIYLLADGSQYTGAWKSGVPDGNGAFFAERNQNYRLSPNGDKGKPLVWTAGSRYNGNLKNGIPEGQGIMSWADGRTYNGTWKAGKPSGKGFMNWSDGRTYSGEWQAGKRHGKGILSWSDRSRFAGTWQEDTFSGKGTFTSRLRETFEGNWYGTPEKVVRKDGEGALMDSGVFRNGLYITD